MGGIISFFKVLPWTTIIPIAISLSALLVSALSYRKSKRRGRLERAVEEARRYIGILDDISTICWLINEINSIRALVEQNKPTEACLFTRGELESRYKDEELQKLKLFYSFRTVPPSLMATAYVGEHINEFIAAGPDREENEKASEVYLGAYFSDKLANLLNNLECFSMAFNSELADSNLVFQSLHQSFFEVVQALYYPIASRNDNDAEKYFTNIIALYRKWLRLKRKTKKRVKKQNARHLIWQSMGEKLTALIDRKLGKKSDSATTSKPKV